MAHKISNSDPRRRTTAVGLSIGLGAVILMALLLSLRLTAVAAPNQTTWYVYPGGFDGNTGSLLLPFKTIQHAIGVAADGDTILVAAGTYTENLVITESLTLHGSYVVSGSAWLPPGTIVLPDADETIINGSGAISQPVVNITATTAGVTLDGFTITGGRGTEVGGVAAGGNVVIHNCIVRNNTAANEGWGAGGVLGYDGVLTIVDSLIVDNRFSGDGAAGGVRAGDSSLIMVNTVVADNHGDPGLNLPAVHVNTDLTLVNVTVANNDGDIVFHPLTATLTITNTIAYSHTHTYLTGCPSGSDCQVNYSNIQGWTGGGTGNITADPQFVDAASGDYHLKPGSPCIDTGTTVGAPAADVEGTVRDDSPDMGAYEWVGFRIFLPIIVRNS
jgi:hypothetical protein